MSRSIKVFERVKDTVNRFKKNKSNNSEKMGNSEETEKTKRLHIRPKAFFGSIGSSIAKKMIVLGILLIVVVIVSSQFIALSYSKSTLIKITSTQSKMLAEQHASTINTWITDIMGSTKEIASKRLMSTDVETLIKEQFHNLNQSHREVTKVFLVDGKSGKEIYSMTGNTHTDFSDKEYFKQARDTKQAVVSDVEITLNAEKSTLYVATPIGDTNDNTDRILIAGFSINKLVKEIPEFSFMEHGYAFVVNHDGLVMAHKDKEQNNKLDLKQNNAYSEMLQLMTAGQSNSVLYDDGVDSFAAFAPIPSVNWFIILATPIDEVYGEVNGMGGAFILFSIPVIILASAIIWWFAKGIRVSLHQIAGDMQRIGSGDLNVEVQVSGRDEIALVANSMNEMVTELRKIISLVQGQATQLNVAADDLNVFAHGNKQAIDVISNNISSISERVQVQTSEVQNTAHTVAEISQGVEQVAIAAEHTSIATTRTFERAQNGRQLVEDVIHGVRSATKEVEATAYRMHTLRDRAKEITSIVEMIRAIASQTNLLALNAAIEAARAGDAGKGFSVVATEVRKLAEESSNFSEKIAQIARSINDESIEMSNNMDDVAKMVGDGLLSVESVGQNFQLILSDIQAAAEQGEAMTATAEEMAAGNQMVTSSMGRLAAMSDEINKSITGVVDTIDEQFASIARINESAENLKTLADDLSESVKRFQI